MKGKNVVEGLLLDLKTSAKELEAYMGHHLCAFMYGFTFECR